MGGYINIKLFIITARNMNESESSLGHVEFQGLRARCPCPDSGWEEPGRWGLVGEGIRLVWETQSHEHLGWIPAFGGH